MIGAPFIPALKDLSQIVPRRRMRRGRATLLALLLPLGRAHLPPLTLQFLSLLRRSLFELLKLFAYALLLFGRQALELLPPLAQLLPLLGRHRAPLAEPLLRARALLRAHREPAIAPFGERLLSVGRQALPLATIALQQFLLLWGQGRPRARRGRSRARRR